MKTEFELTVDQNGQPIIKFKHHEKSDSIEQKLLKVFIDSAEKNGLKLVNPSGFISDTECYEKYEIQINELKLKNQDK